MLLPPYLVGHLMHISADDSQLLLVFFEAPTCSSSVGSSVGACRPVSVPSLLSFQHLIMAERTEREEARISAAEEALMMPDCMAAALMVERKVERMPMEPGRC